MPRLALVLAGVSAGTGASAYLHNCPCLVVTVARIAAAPLETARHAVGGGTKGHKKQRPNEAGREGKQKEADNNLQQAKRSNELNMKRKMENTRRKCLKRS